VTFDVLFDSCVLAKLVIVESDSDVARELLSSLLEQGQVVGALDLAHVEVGNVIWKTWRRGLIDKSGSELALDELQDLPIHLEPARPYLPRALQLGMNYQIAVYDALFVAAVEAFDCTGITSDAALVKRISPNHPRIQLLSTPALPNA
jgi:predicted nucleic acid-binding protein